MKRRWIKEYRCSKFSMNIIARMKFCKEIIEDKKCRDCKYRGNEDDLADLPITIDISSEEEI
jgi:hypothetical protein